MTIFVLLILGLVFLFLTGIIIACDNRKRKYKKKTLRLHWRILGIVFTVIAVVSLGQFVRYVVHFDGEEYGDRKVLLRSTMTLSDVKIPSGDAKLDQTLADSYKEIIEQINSSNSEQKIEYVDALLSKRQIPLEKIHEVKYSEDLSAKQVQIVEYLVVSKDGYFTMPEVYYYIIFSQELLPKEEDSKDKKSDTAAKKSTKKVKKKGKK